MINFYSKISVVLISTCIVTLLFLSYSFTQPQVHTPMNLQEQLKLAELYQRWGKLKEALMVYERLDSSFPNNPQVLRGLQSVYLQLGMSEQLINLLHKKIKDSPREPELYKLLGDTYAKLDNPEQARLTWQKIIELAPHQQDAYHTVAGCYISHRMYVSAESTYLRGRETIGKVALFSLELANLYEHQQNYEKAIKEYLHLLHHEPHRYQYVQNQLLRITRKTNDFSTAIKSLESLVKEYPERADYHRLLGILYLEKIDPPKALTHYKIVEVLEQSQGKTLFEFGEECESKGLYREAIDAYNQLVITYPQSNLVLRAKLKIAQLTAVVGDYAQALSAYRQFIQANPRHIECAEAYFQIGMLYLSNLHEPDSAIVAFESVIKLFPHSPSAEESQFKIAEAYLSKGELETAKEKYYHIIDDKRFVNGTEKALFGLAELEFLASNFSDALEKYQDIVIKFPKGSYINDSLRRSIFIEENLMKCEEPLRIYTTALFLAYQQKFDNAIEQYNHIVNLYPDCPLTDDVLWEVAILYELLSEYKQAISTYRLLIDRYPDSNLNDKAHSEIGRIYAVHLKDKQKALHEYELVLTNYPESLILDEVRREIRKLRANELP